MNTEEEEKEAAKAKPRLNIPDGALVILPYATGCSSHP